MFADLDGALDGLAEVDLAALSDAELSAAVVASQQRMNRLAAVHTALTSAWEARGCWAADGVRTPAAWLADRCRLPAGDARAQVRSGRMLRHLPVTAAALAAGEIGVAQVRVLLGAVNPRTAARFADDEKLLVDAARTLAFDDFVAAVRYWSQHADPDGCERDVERQAERRGVHLHRSVGGLWFGTITLSAIQGAIVAEALRRIEAELFDADWAEARARLGDLVSVDALRRTPAQRRADALVELAIRAHTTPAGGQRPAPMFSVLVGYETLGGRVCELADGTVLTPGQLVAWLTEADIERAVFDGPSRIIDIGARTRLFRGALRRAIQVRDRHCQGPACRIPADQCDIDHIEPYNGHNTVQANGQPLCGWHNQRKGRQPPPSASPEDGDGDPGDNDQPDTDTAA